MSSNVGSFPSTKEQAVDLKKHQNQELQSLRAIAVGGVVLFHVGLPSPAGYLGVDVFFVISGYVIVGSILRRLHNSQFSVATFFARRYLRLAPALGVCVALIAILTPFFSASPTSTRSAWETAAASVVGLANIQLLWERQPYFASESNLNPLLNMWSLSVEEQFYLALGVLIALVGMLRFRSQIASLRVVMWSILAFSIGILVYLIVFQPISNVTDIIFYTPFTRAWQFALGGLVALGPRIGIMTRFRRIWLILGSALILISFSLPITLVGTSAATTGAMLGAVLFVSAASSDGRDVGIFRRGFLPRIGDYSYSIYLWHWPIIVFFVWTFPEWPEAALVSLALSLPLSWLSYKAVEQRFRFRSFSLRYVVTFSVLPLVVISLMNSLLSVIVVDTGSELRSKTPSLSSARECTGVTVFDERCRWDLAKSDDYVLLVGDSQADAFSDVAAVAAREQGLDLVVSSISGCPYLGPASDQQLSGDCRDRNEHVDMQLRENAPSLLVIANRTSGYLNPWGSKCGEPNLRCSAYQTLNTPTGALATSTEEGVETYSDQMSSLMSLASSRDIPVVLIKTAPHQPILEATGPSAVQRLLGSMSSQASLESTRQSVWDERSVTDGVEARLLSNWLEQLVLVDPVDALCSDSVCPVVLNDVPLYKDRFHISPEAATLLEEPMTRALHQALHL